MAKTSPIAAPPSLTDPHLVALLMYIDNLAGDDEEGSTAAIYAHVLADVDALLRSHPLTSAFEGMLDRPSPADAVLREVTRQLARQSEDDNRAATLHAHVKHAEVDDDFESICGERRDWESILWRYSDVGMLYGAILMYRLLQGQQRA